MDDLAKLSLAISKDIQEEIPQIGKPPDEGFFAESDKVIPFSYVCGTRKYIKKVVNQINGCYERGWFDACAVMIRRLIETLIIESFEHNGIDSKIKNHDGNFISLDELIIRAINEPTWNLGRTIKNILPKIPEVGNLAAHNRRYNAHLADVDKFIGDLRAVVQEFLALAGY